jgi:hypothetical protein
MSEGFIACENRTYQSLLEESSRRDYKGDQCIISAEFESTIVY